MIDKIIRELKANKFEYWDCMNDGDKPDLLVSLDRAIEIVKKYDNDGWIDVRDALPTKSNSYLTYWIDGFGNHGFYVLYWDDGRKGFYPKWEGNQSRQEIAWRELPSPFVRREK